MKTIYVTEAGRKKLEQKIRFQLEHIENIRNEKEVAYESSGDGWHDNPGFNNLMREEERAVAELHELQTKLAMARVADTNFDKVPESVCIGAVVTYELNNLITGRTKLHKMMIVGSGETDTSASMISYDSPIGSALIGMKQGEEKHVVIPAGKCLIKVVGIEINES